MKLVAQIIASYGRQFIVRDPNGKVFNATTRKKRVDYACGDHVHISAINDEQVVIEDYLPRQSLLFRQDNWKTKLIAANVTQLLIVMAAIPAPNEMLLQRALLASEAAGINAIIILNKADLSETASWKTKLSYYTKIGYPLIAISALENVDELHSILEGQCNIFLGQSGMGKSTLTNALLGERVARVGNISSALNTGKHTTTHAELYDLNAATQLIDSPGLQEFGLKQLDPQKILSYFPDMKHLIGKCRFHNCTHRAEPGCVVKEASNIPAERIAFMQRITDELLR